VHVPIVSVRFDVNAPWVAADLTVLDETAAHIQLEVDLDRFPAVWAGEDKRVLHRLHYFRDGFTASALHWRPLEPNFKTSM
jgi:hypothetical protein